MCEKSINQRVKEKVNKDGAAAVKKWTKRFEDNQASMCELADQVEVITKKCTKCDEVKALDAFYTEKLGKYGRRSACKDCIKKKRASYYEENKEQVVECARKYYGENKERIAEKARKFREENKDKVTEYARKYREENKERLTEYRRKYRKENKEKIAEGMRKYHQENPEVMRRVNRKRRALLRNLPHAPLTSAQYERLYEFRDQVFGEVTS